MFPIQATGPVQHSVQYYRELFSLGEVGFVDIVVLATGPKDRWFKPGRGR
jgi:hypothetical protein